MDDELRKACALYSEICERSVNGKGMSISEIKKKYGFKKRDIIVLLQFLIDVTDFEYCVDFIKYGKNGEEQDVYLDDLEESASDGSIYILIRDNCAFLLQNRMDVTELNIQNDTFFQNIKSSEADAALKKISNIQDSDLESFIMSKGIKKDIQAERKKRIALITAILNKNVVKVERKDLHQGFSCKTICPLGLRYVKLREMYELIYSENDTEIKKMDVSMITKMEPLQEKYNQSFNIYEYIKEQRKTKMVLDIYNEGNVIKKIDGFLSEYDVDKQEKEDCTEYSFMVENADMFEPFIKSYGRSVIVVEPASLREKIYQDSKKILDFYRTLDREYPGD